MIVEVNNSAQRLTVVEVTLNMSVPREAADAHLNPSVAANALRLRQPEVFHDSKTLSVRTKLRMPKTRAAIFIGVRKRKFVPYRVLLQKTESVADPDVVVRLGKQPGPHEIGSEHNKQIGAGSRFLSADLCGILCLIQCLIPRVAGAGQKEHKAHGKENLRSPP